MKSAPAGNLGVIDRASALAVWGPYAKRGGRGAGGAAPFQPAPFKPGFSH